MPNLAVFSTSVEVFPSFDCSAFQIYGLLHVRGGVSSAVDVHDQSQKSSPRPWRCFLLATLWALSLVCLLHVRGGVSAKVTIQRHGALSSPRPWRCFYNPALARGSFLVFSTSVEVFPVAGRTRSASGCLLHVRGGVSLGNFEVGATTGSSPRPWRCFSKCHNPVSPAEVFSTSVEVFLRAVTVCKKRASLLHVRGGVSPAVITIYARTESSPRPWRCFQVGIRTSGRDDVFSTSVEVFPCRSASEKSRQQSSPRPWRCF